MTGAADPLYAAARKALLDALEAFGDQRSAVVLVGAQAIYLHTGEAAVAVAPYTTDADLAVDPAMLRTDPRLDDAMRAAHFHQGNQPGSWIVERQVRGEPVTIPVDLLVPEAVAGPGRRSARLDGHGDRTARRAKGLEAALIDNGPMIIAALEPQDLDRDDRVFEIRVAGPTALLVAKLHKLADRAREARGDRIDDKDALDLFRLLQAIPTEVLASTLTRLLEAPVTSDVTTEALEILRELFALPRSIGCAMVVRATEGLEDPETIARSCSILARAVLQAVGT